MSTTGERSTKEIFCDTSVLLSYVLGEGNSEVRELLTEVGNPVVISEKVEAEFTQVPERREDIYLDFTQLITSDEEDISEATVQSRDYLKPNDRQFFQYLRDEISGEETQIEKLTALREKQKMIDRRYGQVEEIIEHVYEQNDDIGLLLKLGRVVDNEDDCQVVVDAVDWALNGGSGIFVTLDVRDLVSNSDGINGVIDDYHETSSLLTIAQPGRVVEMLG